MLDLYSFYLFRFFLFNSICVVKLSTILLVELVTASINSSSNVTVSLVCNCFHLFICRGCHFRYRLNCFRLSPIDSSSRYYHIVTCCMNSAYVSNHVMGAIQLSILYKGGKAELRQIIEY